MEIAMLLIGLLLGGCVECIGALTDAARHGGNALNVKPRSI